MANKKLLTKMEGKHHDRRKPYSRESISDSLRWALDTFGMPSGTTCEHGVAINYPCWRCKREGGKS